MKRAVFLNVLLSAVLACNLSHAQSATEILKQSGVKGGLIVHLGSGDGHLTAALRAS